jgi:8-oxo-dGTP pyrophosphatase MutT (NUDIX family)
MHNNKESENHEIVNAAGGVVIYRHDNTFDVLLILDMQSKLTFPKGLVDPGEQNFETAKREIAEETGAMDIIHLFDLPDISYPVVWNNNPQIKVVKYYVFEIYDKPVLVPQRIEGINSAVWMNVDQAIQVVGYEKTNVPLLKIVKDLLNPE